MKCFNDGAPLPIQSDVIVIGGGFTAVDCARTSRRLLGPDAGVSIMYRRGEGQMSANSEELREMREEGVRIETLVTPLAATLDEGQLQAITFCRNVLGSRARRRQAGYPAGSRQRVRRALPNAHLFHRPVARHANPAPRTCGWRADT